MTFKTFKMTDVDRLFSVLTMKKREGFFGFDVFKKELYNTKQC